MGALHRHCTLDAKLIMRSKEDEAKILRSQQAATMAREFKTKGEHCD